MSFKCPSSRRLKNQSVLARGKECACAGGWKVQNMGQILPLKTCLRPGQGQHKRKGQVRLNEQGLEFS